VPTLGSFLPSRCLCTFALQDLVAIKNTEQGVKSQTATAGYCCTSLQGSAMPQGIRPRSRTHLQDMWVNVCGHASLGECSSVAQSSMQLCRRQVAVPVLVQLSKGLL
jgi:hypothetical protein